MHSRAAELIGALGLAPHPAGGHFHEIYRSDARLHALEVGSERAALTTIYFLLVGYRVAVDRP